MKYKRISCDDYQHSGVSDSWVRPTVCKLITPVITRIPWVKVVLNDIWNPADQKAELFFQPQQHKK